MKGSFSIEGGKEVLRALRGLPYEYQEKELAKAPGKGARVMRDRSRELSPVYQGKDPRVRAGTLRKMIRSTSGKRNLAESAAYVFVKLLSKKAVRKFKQSTGLSARDNPDDPFYWKFQEFGTVKMPAANGGKGFLRAAFDSTKAAAAQLTVDEMRKGIDRAAKKVASRRLF